MRILILFLFMLPLALAGCGSAQLISVDPIEANIEGGLNWEGESHIVPDEPTAGEWFAEGELGTDATARICVKRGISSPLCVDVTAGMRILQVGQLVTVELCYSAAGVVSDCRLFDISEPAAE